MRLLLSDAANLLNEYVEYGMCSTDPRVVTGINLAIERLLPALNPEKTISRYQFDVNDSQITLPREVKTVLAASTEYPACTGGHCGPGCKSIISVKSRWYEMLPGGPVGFVRCAPNVLIDEGTGFSTFADPSTENPLTMRVYADLPQPTREGQVMIRGLDAAGNNLVSYTNNMYVPAIGVAIPIQGENFNDSPMMVSEIKSVTLPVTAGVVRLYGVDASGAQTALGAYEPNETAPDYRRYLLSWVGEQMPAILTVLAKRQFVWASLPYADLLITNIGALQNALMAMKYEKAGTFQQAQAYWKIAFDALEKETRDYDGDYRPTVQFGDTYGGGDIWNLR
jgi:hypothetical protein